MRYLPCIFVTWPVSISLTGFWPGSSSEDRSDPYPPFRFPPVQAAARPPRSYLPAKPTAWLAQPRRLQSCSGPVFACCKAGKVRLNLQSTCRRNCRAHTYIQSTRPRRYLLPTRSGCPQYGAPRMRMHDDSPLVCRRGHVKDTVAAICQLPLTVLVRD